MKNLYGVTPWGSWFIDVLDSYQMGERLDRGRRYANAGKVLSLELTHGRAAAKVEGRSSPFYRVVIGFPPLAEAEKVYKIIEKDPQLMARIASGELPETFLQKLKKEGINLIPRKWREMKRSCTCPDYGDPCKHMAALYYIIAAEIDSNPHTLFRLRGMDLESRFGKALVKRIAPPYSVTFSDREKTGQSQPFEPIEFEEIPYCGELITSLLPENPPFCSSDFSAVLAEFYHRLAGLIQWESALDEEDFISRAEHDFSRSVWTAQCPSLVPGAEPSLLAEDINGNKKRYTLFEAFNYFTQFSSEEGTESYSFLFYLFKFLYHVCSAGAFVPCVVYESQISPISRKLSRNNWSDDDDSVINDEETIKIIWKPFENLPYVSKTLNAIASRECGMLSAPPLFKFNLSEVNSAKNKNKSQHAKTRNPVSNQRTGKQTVSGRSVVDIISCALLSEWVRNKFFVFREEINKGANNEYKQLLNLFFLGMYIDVSTPAKRSLPMAIDRWLSVLHIDFSTYRYAITIKDLSKREEDSFGFINFSISMDVITSPDDGTEAAKKTPLSKCGDIEILRAPIALSNYLPEIKDLFTNQKMALSETRLISFLDSSSALLKRLGMIVNLPKALARELKPRLIIKGKTEGGSLVKYLDLDSLQDFEWRIAIGDEVMTIREFEALAAQKRSMVRFKDGYVKMQAKEFASLLKKAKSSAPDRNDFLKAHFSGDSDLSFNARESINKIFREHDFPIPSALNADLRNYQIRGYNWICSLLLSGFGCVLADDMGLGKTIQSIAVLLRLKEENLLKKECLIVAPAALLNNWEKELGKFAPSLKVTRYHGNRRKFNGKHDIYLTTYQTAVRDEKKLKNKTFSFLLVDEAHLMKNSGTRITKAVKTIKSKYKLALSGTPVENRLEDLRSLFDFILPGYLGNAKNFKEQYRIPIEVMRNKKMAQSLTKITSPFLLRRLKTDKKIIKDLPDKIVSNEYAVLEKEQAVLYETVVAESMKKSKEANPKERPSLIFYLLTSLKQICNHPRVYDKESPAIMELSGKARLLVTLLEKILANREKTLVFSQYVETLDCLQRIIKKELGEAPLIYHGSMSQNTRTETIEKFQTDPRAKIMLTSLKAGGLGLNLTAASRVIHYDLWYNPSVENQATDRAFRIGQEKTVFVHRLITRNSFEEKIDAMISGKRELADMTIKSGESWLARMSHEELKEIFER